MNTTGVKNRRTRTAVLQLLKTEYPGALDMKALQNSTQVELSIGTTVRHLVVVAPIGDHRTKKSGGPKINGFVLKTQLFGRVDFSLSFTRE